MRNAPDDAALKHFTGRRRLGQSLLERIGRGRDKPKVEIDWARSRFIDLPLDREPKPELIKEARKRIPMLLEQHTERMECLENFLTDNGLRLGKDDDSLLKIDEFFQTNLHCNDDLTDIHENWADFIVNYAYLIGSIIIERSITGKLKWSIADNSIKKLGEPPRFEYVITGYGSNHLENNIFSMFLQKARWVVKNKGNSDGIFLNDLEGSKFLET